MPKAAALWLLYFEDAHQRRTELKNSPIQTSHHIPSYLNLVECPISNSLAYYILTNPSLSLNYFEFFFCHVWIKISLGYLLKKNVVRYNI